MLAMHPDLNQTAPRESRGLKREAASQSPLDTLAAAAVTTNSPNKQQHQHQQNAHTADQDHNHGDPSEADQLKDRQLAAAVAAAEEESFTVKADALSVPGRSSSSSQLQQHQPQQAGLWAAAAPNPTAAGSDDAAIDTEIKALSDPTAKHGYAGGYPSENYQQHVNAAAASVADFSYGSPQGGSPPNAMSLERLNNPVVSVPAGYAHGLLDGGSPNSGKTPRKKKQCDVCGRFYSNLATHKSIHMSDNSRPHTCGMCGRGFARPNDMFRHQKSHRGKAPFRCPLFYKPPTIPLIEGSNAGLYDPPCHQNGGFSRCDTYKNHLKAMHFEYPAGTKKRDRAGMEGKCRACKLHFSNADDWIANHIETKQCEGIKRIESRTEGLV